MRIRLGTRQSKLALWQAHFVQHALENAGHSVELVYFKTTGDIRLETDLHVIGEKGLFTKALDDALLNQEIDIAVHSAKDVPGEFPEGLEICAVTQREDPRDVLLALDETCDLDNLNRQLVVGTSSQRRKAFLRQHAPHCEIKMVRGNLDTRVRKLVAGEFDALILAYAGVKRLGYEQYIIRKLNISFMTPAVGQGALIVMSRKSDPFGAEVRAILNHLATERCVQAERAYLHEMQGGCSTPVFALATEVAGSIELIAGVAAPTGEHLIRETMTGSATEPIALGRQVASKIIQAGGKKLIYGN